MCAEELTETWVVPPNFHNDHVEGGLEIQSILIRYDDKSEGIVPPIQK